MRISTSQMYDSMTARIDAASSALQAATEAVSSGKKFTTLSQDPFAATQSLNIRSMQNSLAQYSTNLGGLQTTLNTSSSALDGINTLLQNANQVALASATVTTSPASRAQYATQIAQLQSQLLSLGNSVSPDGQYVFAGQKNDSAPFSAANGVATFSGDTKNVSVEVGPGQTVNSNVDISSTLTDAYSKLETLRNDLISGDTTALSQDAGKVQAANDSVLKVVGDVGNRLSQVKQNTDDNTRRQVELTSRLTDNEDLDYASAITNLQETQNAYQAALSISSYSSKLSLMDYLK